MRTRYVLFLAVTLIIAGCVPSLHSIVTEKTLTYDPALVGKWQTNDAVWTITGDAENKSYDVEILEKEDKKSKLKAQLVELQGHRFLDMVAEDDNQLNTGGWFKAHLIPVHIFWQLKKTDNGYALYGLIPDGVKDLLKEKPQMVRHELIEDDRVVLTDTPENLHKFLLAAIEIEDLYDDIAVLKPVTD